ncbi:MAG: sulfatase-like hydrolase/transferase [Myxococcota bacterium]|nr:sulfatase-like hydrolase/transferase [Myxococcota bacterium]
MSHPRSPRLTRRQLLRSLAGAAVAAGAGRRARAAGRPPNIVFVLSDNHRWDCFGAAGHPFVKTPALDRIAREGVLFANAFCTTPLCSPARASFLTGLYAWQHGVHNNANRSRWDDDNVTFLETLKGRSGYATAFIGKWHMPGSGLPHLRGVDHFVTFTVQDGQGRYFDCPLVVDGREEVSRRPYLTDELTDRAVAFVDAHRGEPFCLYLSHKAAHFPWKPPPDLEGTYAREPVALPDGANRWTGFVDGNLYGGVTRPLESAIRAYLETVSGMDRSIGRLLERLDALDLADDTIVVYASDNGFLFGEHGRTELRWPYEEVMRIPLLVRHPRAVRRPDRRAPQMALNIDLAPTLLELAGAGAPEGMQGTSLAPVLRHPDAPGRKAWLVENTKEFPYRTPSYQGVRTERWLYLEYEGRFEPTLHEIARDPQQKRNLFGRPEAEAVLPGLRATLEGLRRGERFDA